MREATWGLNEQIHVLLFQSTPPMREATPLVGGAVAVGGEVDDGGGVHAGQGSFVDCIRRSAGGYQRQFVRGYGGRARGGGADGDAGADGAADVHPERAGDLRFQHGTGGGHVLLDRGHGGE